MTLTVERRDTGQLAITLSRPRQRNAITVAMYAALADAVEGAAKDASVRVITIEGEGEDFTAGNDLYDFLKEMPAPGTTDIPVWRFLRAMANNQVPIIAAVHGNAVGIGTTMLFHCDLVIAEQGAPAATAEESGVVYVVVGELWEWATGLSDEEANLRKHIRLGVRHGQLVAAQSKVRTDIEDEVTRYQASLTEAPLPEARREHKQRLRALQAEQDRLTRKLLGSNPPQDEPKQGQQKQDKPG